ncbi:acyltransferase [Nocardiopsis sediminis]|uniref:Acyltransferase n=1 Tax=Nocardiopsis sediminis TaxID=1778267 RepID=A0ABV8FJW3_9ACTN
MAATTAHAPTAGSPAAAPPHPTAWLDFARVAAMLAVVLVHVFAPVVTTVHSEFASPAWWTANAVDSMLRWCVPVFVMISGALLLRPRDEGLRRFYTKRFSRIGVPLAVWTALYVAWEIWRTGISPMEAVSDVLSGAPSLHLYFLFVLAGLYVLTPFLRVLVEHSTTVSLWWFAAVMSAIGMADQAISALDGVGEPNAATRFLPYIGYYFMGYLLTRTAPTRRAVWTAGAVFAASVAATGAGAAALALLAGGWGGTAAYVYDYLSPTVLAMSAAAFVLLRAAGTRLYGRTGTPRWLSVLSSLSFGVFLVHVVVLYTLRDITGVPGSAHGMLAMAGLHATAVLTVSLLVTALFQRIPGLRATV